MSVATILGVEVETEYKGNSLKLPPLTLLELAKLENPYIRFRRESVWVDTEHLPEKERRAKLDDVNRERVLLGDDLQPLFRWIVLNSIGQIESLRMCFDAAQPGVMSPRDVALWLASHPSDFDRWLVASGILPDPTTPPTSKKTTLAEKPQEDTTQTSEKGSASTT